MRSSSRRTGRGRWIVRRAAAALVCALATTGLGVPATASPVPGAPRIIGGRPAAEGAYPWIVRLGFGVAGQCGGSLVSPDIVITAQHCLEYATSLTADIGRVRWSEAAGAGARRTSAKASWRLGGGPTKVEDWAVVRLDQPYTAQPPVAMAVDATLDVAPTFRVMGWGKTQPTGGVNSEVLMEVDVPRVGQENCPDFKGKKEGREICAGDWEKGGVDSCTNDSGGPLVARDGERWVLVGIVSWGYGCAKPRSPGHYSAVSHHRETLRRAIVDLGGQLPAGL